MPNPEMDFTIYAAGVYSTVKRRIVRKEEDRSSQIRKNRSTVRYGWYIPELHTGERWQIERDDNFRERLVIIAPY